MKRGLFASSEGAEGNLDRRAAMARKQQSTGAPPAEVSPARGVGAWLVGRFSRVTTSGGFISEIDGLRFIAIGTVVLFHLVVDLAIKSPGAYAIPADSILATVALHGFHGVELFFVISGFILALPFASHRLKGARRVDLKQYFIRRVTRLEPPYILCMLIVFAALVLLKGRDARGLLPHLAASLVYLHNVTFGTESLVNNVAWSLEIEIQFYLLVPLLAGVFTIRDHRSRRGLLAAVIAASVLLSWRFVTPAHARAYWSILRFLHFFLLGFLLADVYLVNWGGKPARSHGWDLVSLLGWPALFAVWGRFDGGYVGEASFVSAVFFPLATFLLYLAAFRGRLTNALITNRWLTTIGGMCYTIYLFHNPLLGMILGLTGRLAPTGSYALNVLAQAAVAVPAMLVPCGIYFLAVEKPCMRKDWPRRLLDRLRAGVLATPRA
jgi:peptidoglycan/LPS O-acetylase OafA/YrhL